MHCLFFRTLFCRYQYCFFRRCIRRCTGLRIGRCTGPLTALCNPDTLFIEMGVTRNAPTNTARKSTTAIPVVMKKSKHNSIAILIQNNIQKIFLLFSLEIIFDNGKSTNTDICIDTNASINKAIAIPIPWSPIPCISSPNCSR